MLETLPPTLVWHLPCTTDDLVAEYLAYQQAAGYAVDGKVRPWAARAFLQRYPDLEGWRQAPLAEQLSLQRSLKYFANFLFLKHYLRPTLRYLLTARPQLAKVGKRSLHAPLYDQFYTLGQQLGYADSVLGATLNCLFYVMTHAGKPVGSLTEEDVQAFEQELRTYHPPAGYAFSLRTYSQHLYRVRGLLFHAGIFPAVARRYRPHPARSRAEFWAAIPPPLRQVVWRYLDQLATVRAPDTVTNNEGYLRRFFTWLAQAHPDVQHLGQLTRAQVEAFNIFLQQMP